MAVLPKLSTGLDVNVRFTGVADFEYTPECIVFDLLDIPLFHGWLVDPQVKPHLCHDNHLGADAADISIMFVMCRSFFLYICWFLVMFRPSSWFLCATCAK